MGFLLQNKQAMDAEFRRFRALPNSGITQNTTADQAWNLFKAHMAALAAIPPANNPMAALNTAILAEENEAKQHFTQTHFRQRGGIMDMLGGLLGSEGGIMGAMGGGILALILALVTGSGPLAMLFLVPLLAGVGAVAGNEYSRAQTTQTQTQTPQPEPGQLVQPEVVGRLYNLPTNHQMPVSVARTATHRYVLGSVSTNGSARADEILLGTFIDDRFRPTHIMRLNAQRVPQYLQINNTPTVGYAMRSDGSVDLPANMAFTVSAVDTTLTVPPGSIVPPPRVNGPIPAVPTPTVAEQAPIISVYMPRGSEAFTVVTPFQGNLYRYNGEVLDAALPTRRFHAISVQRVDASHNPIPGESQINLGNEAFDLSLELLGDETIGYRGNANNIRATHRPLAALAEMHTVSLLPNHPNLNNPEVKTQPARNGNAAYQYIEARAIIDGRIQHVSIRGNLNPAGDQLNVTHIYIADGNGAWGNAQLIVGNGIGQGTALSLNVTQNPGYPATVQLAETNAANFETLVQRGVRRYRTAAGTIGNFLAPGTTPAQSAIDAAVQAIPDTTAALPFLNFAGSQAFQRVPEQYQPLTTMDQLSSSFTTDSADRSTSGWLNGSFRGQNGSVYIVSSDGGVTVSHVAVDAGDGTRRDIPLGGAAFALANATPEALYARINAALSNAGDNNWRLFQGRGRLNTTNAQDEHIRIRGGAGNGLFPPTDPARQVIGDTVGFHSTGNTITADRNLMADALTGRIPDTALLSGGVAAEYQTDWVAVQVNVGGETETRHVRLRGFRTAPGISSLNPFSANGGSNPLRFNRFSVTGIDLVDETGAVVPANTRAWQFFPELTIQNGSIDVTSRDSQASLQQALGRVLRANPNQTFRMASNPLAEPTPRFPYVEGQSDPVSPRLTPDLASIPGQLTPDSA